MRLIIATPLYPPEIGGPATYVKLLEAGLPPKGIDVEVVKFSDVRHLPKLIRHYSYYRRVLRAAKGADVILALDPVSVGFPAMCAARKLRKPLVVKIVGDYAWEQGRQRFGVTQTLDEFARSPRPSLMVRLLQRIQLRVASAAVQVIVPSNYLSKIVAAWGVPPQKVMVIYNGVEMPAPSPRARTPGFTIVSSGRPVPWKGFEGLKRVVAREPEWRLSILSDLPRAEALAQIQAAGVFVLNSDYEGLSHVLIEVMALGTPIVATNVGGNPELIEDGKTGILIPPQDDEALYRALKAIEANPAAASSRAEAGRVSAQAFSQEAMLEKTAVFLKTI